jgi:MarR family transcriptional regulator, organic hydroperoxide resistance regulator
VTGDRKYLINEIIGYQKQIGHIIHGDGQNVWLALNLTIAQLKSLMFIRYRGQTNFKTLASALRVSPPNVTGIVDRLVEQGLVSREDNPENRRMQILKVTEKGERLTGELMERGDTYLYTTLDRMKTEDLECLSRGMAALISIAKLRRPDNAESCDDEAEDF